VAAILETECSNTGKPTLIVTERIQVETWEQNRAYFEKVFLRQKPHKNIHLEGYSHRQSGASVAAHYNFAAWNRLIKKKIKREVWENVTRCLTRPDVRVSSRIIKPSFH